MAKWQLVEPKEKYNNTDPIIDKILKIRGINNKDQFLNPKEEDLNSPWDLSNMREAADKIINAIENNYKIGIYSDIDTDGVTALTIMFKYLNKFDTISPIILYHQRKDGHGVIVSNIPKDLDLLIIVDSSSNSAKECEELSNYMDIIILDHHNFERKNEYAIIVNPQYNNYPNKHLSGAGVVYQICRAIDEMFDISYASEFIDICAVGLIGDMMNVTIPETRYLIYEGLLKIQNDCDKNLLAILKSLKKEYKPNATTIAFYLVPFINAIIRLGKIEDIIEILTTDDDQRIKELIKLSGGKNNERKILQADIVGKIEQRVDLSHKMIIFDVSDLKANKTLNGLIANNVAQKYQKPTLIVSLDNDTGLFNGSGRGYSNKFDFKKTLSNTNLFKKIEGHKNAFGVEFEPDNLNEIFKIIDKELENDNQELTVEVDMIINSEDITWNLAYDSQILSFITGEGFKDPIFLVKDLIPEEIKIMKDVHLKFNAEELECVKFNISEEEKEQIQNSFFIDIVGSIGINSWYNFGTRKTVKTRQIMVKDFLVK
jgi:single-stranded-DNA-specific exonuclease